MNTTAPDGYDQKLWNSIPSVRAMKHRSKHETYVFGQSSADGTARIGCSWKTNRVLTGAAAVGAHDATEGLTHDHDAWVPVERGPEADRCPCGNQPQHSPISLGAESVRAELQEAPEAHGLDAAEAAALQALNDDDINAAVQESAGDAFWEQYDAVRRRAIARLNHSAASPT